MLRIRVCLALLVAGLLAPAVALGHASARSARGAQRSAILAAAVHQGEVSSRQAPCLNVTVVAVNTSYAALSWPAKLTKACAAVAADGVIIEHESDRTWQVVAAGSSFQCPVKSVPAAVARDLGICS